MSFSARFKINEWDCSNKQKCTNRHCFHGEIKGMVGSCGLKAFGSNSVLSLILAVIGRQFKDLRVVNVKDFPEVKLCSSEELSSRCREDDGSVLQEFSCETTTVKVT